MGKWSQHWYLQRQNKFFMGFKHWTNWGITYRIYETSLLRQLYSKFARNFVLYIFKGC